MPGVAGYKQLPCCKHCGGDGNEYPCTCHNKKPPGRSYVENEVEMVESYGEHYHKASDGTWVLTNKK